MDFIFNPSPFSTVSVMPRKLIVPSAGDIAKKWAEETPKRSVYYETETPRAADLWEKNTKAAKKQYKAAVSDPKIDARFVGGVSGKAPKFERKVKDVGAVRFGPGVEAAKTDMEEGFTPYVAVLSTIEVPDRGPRGTKANYAIVEKIGDPLHKKRLALLGALASPK